MSEKTLDLVVETYARAHRIPLVLSLLETLYDSYGLKPGAKPYGHALRMAEKIRRPELARTLLDKMGELGLEITEEQQGAVDRIEARRFVAPPRARRGWRGRRSAGTSRRRRRSGDKRRAGRSGAASTAAARAPSNGGRGGWRGEIS